MDMSIMPGGGFDYDNSLSSVSPTVDTAPPMPQPPTDDAMPASIGDSMAGPAPLAVGGYGRNAMQQAQAQAEEIQQRSMDATPPGSMPMMTPPADMDMAMAATETMPAMSDTMAPNAPTGNVPGEAATTAGGAASGVEAWLQSMRTPFTEPESIAQRYFTTDEFTALHPGDQDAVYHSAQHSENVARVAGEMASTYDPADKEFMQQVGLIHDIDPTRPPGTPARVPATLDWMNQNKDDLMQRFGWDENDFIKAQATIQRTEFPFDDKTRPKSYNDFYKDQSPVDAFKDTLSKLSPEDQKMVLQNGSMLSEYADKASFYMENFGKADQAVDGLVNELGSVGVQTTKEKLGTSGFLEKIGTPDSFKFDNQIAQEMGIKDFKPPLADEVFSNLSPTQANNFAQNIENFKAIETGQPLPASATAAPAADAPKAGVGLGTVVEKGLGVAAVAGGAVQAYNGVGELEQGKTLDGTTDLAGGVLNTAGGVATLAGAAGATVAAPIAFGGAAILDGGRDIIKGYQSGDKEKEAVGGIKALGGSLLVAGGVTAASGAGAPVGAVLAAAGGALYAGAAIYENRQAIGNFVEKGAQKVENVVSSAASSAGQAISDKVGSIRNFVSSGYSSLMSAFR